MTLTLDELRVGQLIAPTDAPGQIGWITELTPTSDGRGTRITHHLIDPRAPRRTCFMRVWPDDHAEFREYNPADYGATPPTPEETTR
ncbi:MULTISPECIES: hypothetical protein [unclassified Nocardiopsis]|uniref:hypothetical protein n=1 Tax=Nocardiopsis TaxID=2013 RepID=UPI00387B4B66